METSSPTGSTAGELSAVTVPERNHIRHSCFAASADDVGTLLGRRGVAFRTLGGECTRSTPTNNCRHLFEAFDQGFCTIEVLFDEAGMRSDYRFLDVNAAFEQRTRLHQAVGRTMRQLAAAHEEHWFQIYGQVALTGKPVRFEQEARALDRWYDVYAFRVGEAQLRRVAVLLSDINPPQTGRSGTARGR
jgi:hypothetical protein